MIKMIESVAMYRESMRQAEIHLLITSRTSYLDCTFRAESKAP